MHVNMSNYNILTHWHNKLGETYYFAQGVIDRESFIIVFTRQQEKDGRNRCILCCENEERRHEDL